jgi:hypothetical protein
MNQTNDNKTGLQTVSFQNQKHEPRMTLHHNPLHRSILGLEVVVVVLLPMTELRQLLLMNIELTTT